MADRASDRKSILAAQLLCRTSAPRIFIPCEPEATTPIISKVLPVANPDTGWKPMLHYPSRGGGGCAELPSESA